MKTLNERIGIYSSESSEGCLSVVVDEGTDYEVSIHECSTLDEAYLWDT